MRKSHGLRERTQNHDIKKNSTLNEKMKFLEKYYPILLAFLSFLYSIYLWFTGDQLEGLYVGLWPVTILAFAIAIRQRRNEDKKPEAWSIKSCLFSAVWSFSPMFIFCWELSEDRRKNKRKNRWTSTIQMIWMAWEIRGAYLIKRRKTERSKSKDKWKKRLIDFNLVVVFFF